MTSIQKTIALIVLLIECIISDSKYWIARTVNQNQILDEQNCNYSLSKVSDNYGILLILI